MIHQCHAYKCTTPVAPRLLMCRKHWAMVPGDIQRAVYAHFNPEQCRGRKAPLPSREWIAAARAAINHVASVEGHMSNVTIPSRSD